jgi:hypothetical protein
VSLTFVTCDSERDTSNNRLCQSTMDHTQYSLAVMPTTTSVLRSSLEKHNETFETLLSLIPAKFYLARDDNNDQVGPIVSLSGLTDTAATGHI